MSWAGWVVKTQGKDRPPTSGPLRSSTVTQTRSSAQTGEHLTERETDALSDWLISAERDNGSAHQPETS